MSGMFAPAKTPRIINRLREEIVRVLNRPDMKERFLAAAIGPVGSSPEEFMATLRADRAKWRKLIDELGIRE